MTPQVGVGPVPDDTVRAALARVFARPEFDWVEPAGPLTWLAQRLDQLVTWVEGLREAQPWAYTALVAALVLVAGTLLLHLGVAAFRVLGAEVETPAVHRESRPSTPDPSTLVARAEELAGAGRYAEALGPLFHATLLHLHSRRAVSYHPSKTPGEYLREAGLDPSGREALRDLVDRLYAHLFGQRDCGDPEWQAFRALAREVPMHVAPG